MGYEKNLDRIFRDIGEYQLSDFVSVHLSLRSYNLSPPRMSVNISIKLKNGSTKERNAGRYSRAELEELSRVFAEVAAIADYWDWKV